MPMPRLSPKLTRWVLAAAYCTLPIALGLQRLDGQLNGNWSIVQFSLLLLTLAFILGLPAWRRK
jgi:hypothetical protein